MPKSPQADVVHDHLDDAAVQEGRGEAAAILSSFTARRRRVLEREARVALVQQEGTDRVPARQLHVAVAQSPGNIKQEILLDVVHLLLLPLLCFHPEPIPILFNLKYSSKRLAEVRIEAQRALDVRSVEERAFQGVGLEPLDAREPFLVQDFIDEAPYQHLPNGLLLVLPAAIQVVDVRGLQAPLNVWQTGPRQGRDEAANAVLVALVQRRPI